MDILKKISKAIQIGNAEDVEKLTIQATESNISALDILTNGIVDGMEYVGGKFDNRQVFIPEVLLSARAMYSAFKIIDPLLKKERGGAVGKVVICTVKGDIHDIGKNIVKVIMQGLGLDVIDLGIDCSSQKVIEAIKKHNPQVVALSVLLTTARDYQKIIIDDIIDAGLRTSVKIMVGGGCVTEEFAIDIGADAYTKDAISAGKKAIELCKEN